MASTLTDNQTMKTYQIIADVHDGGLFIGRKEAIIKVSSEVMMSEHVVFLLFSAMYGHKDITITNQQWAELHEPPLAVPEDQPDNGKLVCATLGGLNRCTKGQPSPVIHW